jgi:surfactin synthase thioesterase subunit
MREQCPDSYAALAAWMVDEVRPVLDRPFGFFGHCGSALLAFEATRACVAAGAPTPAAVFVSSQVAPQDGPYGRYLEMDDDALRSELQAIGPELGSAVDEELLDLVVPGMQRDLDLNRGYRLTAPEPLPCPIRAIGWRDDGEIAPERMTGWAEWGDAAFDVLDGGHRAFLAAPAELLAVFAAALGAP